MSELPEGVKSVMFLRDGWPIAVVCKVVMENGCVGIGLKRYRTWLGPKPKPEDADREALENALACVGDEPPDYTEIQDHVARMKAEAEARLDKSTAATAKGKI
jgi:hypothetical protein